MVIQALLFVVFHLYHLVGQNGTHHFGYSASQSGRGGLGAIWLPLAKQIQAVQGLILFLILAPGFVLPFHLLLQGDQC